MFKSLGGWVGGMRHYSAMNANLFKCVISKVIMRFFQVDYIALYDLTKIEII